MSTPSDQHFGPFDGHPVSGETPTGTEVMVGDSSKNWMGVTALITGALGLSVVAIVLGSLGLKAVEGGRATNRGFALAGTILGYIALAATIIALAAYYLLYAGTQEQETHDAYAQADTAAVGSEIARYWIDNGTPPTVAQSDTSYAVGTASIDATLQTERTVTFYGSQPTQWCFMIEYAGGNEAAWSYLPTEGLVSGARCDSPPSDEPEPEPSPTPEPSPSPTDA